MSSRTSSPSGARRSLASFAIPTLSGARRSLARFAILTLSVLASSGCGGMEGKYSHAENSSDAGGGKMTLELKGGSKVVMTLRAGQSSDDLISTEGTYKVKQDGWTGLPECADYAASWSYSRGAEPQRKPVQWSG